MRDFNTWLKTMRPSINGYDYYIDFDKVYRNVDDIKVVLNILNSLIGSTNIKEDFKALVGKYPVILECIPILLAVRGNENYAQDDEGAYIYNFFKPNLPVEQYVVFMEKTGLFDLISKHLINNLVDYVLGVETGLDSNGRKNRGGHQMEDLVESFIKKTGAEYYKEMYLGDIERKWNVDSLSEEQIDVFHKLLDCVIETAPLR